ncbi:MAG: glycosyltransferase [Gemmatimonadetes bacterium]|nr:glycosyltransferase [Gemmatimonadota bacterium]
MKLVIQSDSRIWGGNEKWLLLVGRGLAERGHEVLVSCKPGRPVAERARAAGLRVTHRRPGGDADIVRAIGFALMLRAERPDAVLLSAFKRSFWAGWACRRAGVRRVVERLGIEHDLPDRWKYRKAFRDYIDALIVNSAVIRDRWLRSAPSFPASEVHVVLNGVIAPALERSTLREELGIPRDARVVAGAGRLEPRKGFDLLLDAFAAAADRGARLVIAGNGPEEAALRDHAAALEVAERVHWLGFRQDLDNVLLGADVFVLPSRREGMANVMLEAMAAGCLVVATDISGVREALGARDGRAEAGWIVPPDDAPAMAAALDRAIEATGGEAGRRRLEETRWRVEHWFAPERTIEDTERVLMGTARAEVTAPPGSTS